MSDIPQLIINVLACVPKAILEWDWRKPCIDVHVSKEDWRRVVPSWCGNYLFLMYADGCDHKFITIYRDYQEGRNVSEEEAIAFLTKPVIESKAKQL